MTQSDVDMATAHLVQKIKLTPEQISRADYNRNGRIDIGDIAAMQTCVDMKSEEMKKWTMFLIGAIVLFIFMTR